MTFEQKLAKPKEVANEIFATLRRACDAPDAVASQCMRAGRKVVRYVGSDLPREMFLASGVLPVQLNPQDGALARSKSRNDVLLARIASAPADEAFAITHADSELAQLFASLRETSSAAPPSRWIEMIDLLHLPRASTLAYNMRRLSQLADRLQELTGHRSEPELRSAIALCNEQKRRLQQLDTARIARRVTGTQMLVAIGAATILPPEEHIQLLQKLLPSVASLPERAGLRIFITGSSHYDTTLYEQLERNGAIIVGEDHDTGQRWRRELVDEECEPLLALASPALRTPLPLRSNDEARTDLRRSIVASQAEIAIHVVLPGDEAAAWDAQRCERISSERGLRFLRWDPAEVDATEILRQLDERLPPATVSLDESTQAVSPRPKKPSHEAPDARSGERSHKSLDCTADFGRYQRTWFAEIRERAARGEPFAVTNANAPQEILRAFDVPFVVNQWWASIVAAKQQTGRYANLLQTQGYPADVEAYSAQGLAACFDDDSQLAPWGGLPKPSLLVAVTSTDATLRIFDSWAQTSGAQLELFERSIDCRQQLSANWWDQLPADWDRALEPERLDLMEAELREHIVRLERLLGRSFSEQRFREVMTLVNEQEYFYRRTRDLIARSVPAPVSIVDTMPATMVPQWHRGTHWGVDAARLFYEEVAGRVARGEAACSDERMRLMWVGRGMWSEMGFYQRWEQSHGAVFVWSMYLGLAADGYIREFDRGRDPLRALAARFVTMGDELRMPTWGGAWHVHEARTHQVDAAVALSDADPFVVRALTAAGFPVLTLPLDNFSKQPCAIQAAERAITQFLEGPVAERAQQRRLRSS